MCNFNLYFFSGDFFGLRDFAGPGFIMCITYAISMGLCAMQTLLELQDKVILSVDYLLTMINVLINKLINYQSYCTANYLKTKKSHIYTHIHDESK